MLRDFHKFQQMQIKVVPGRLWGFHVVFLDRKWDQYFIISSLDDFLIVYSIGENVSMFSVSNDNTVDSANISAEQAFMKDALTLISFRNKSVTPFMDSITYPADHVSETFTGLPLSIRLTLSDVLSCPGHRQHDLMAVNHMLHIIAVMCSETHLIRLFSRRINIECGKHIPVFAEIATYPLHSDIKDLCCTEMIWSSQDTLCLVCNGAHIIYLYWYCNKFHLVHYSVTNLSITKLVPSLFLSRDADQFVKGVSDIVCSTTDDAMYVISSQREQPSTLIGWYMASARISDSVLVLFDTVSFHFYEEIDSAWVQFYTYRTERAAYQFQCVSIFVVSLENDTYALFLLSPISVSCYFVCFKPISCVLCSHQVSYGLWSVPFKDVNAPMQWAMARFITPNRGYIIYGILSHDILCAEFIVGKDVIYQYDCHHITRLTRSNVFCGDFVSCATSDPNFSGYFVFVTENKPFLVDENGVRLCSLESDDMMKWEDGLFSWITPEK